MGADLSHVKLGFQLLCSIALRGETLSDREEALHTYDNGKKMYAAETFAQFAYFSDACCSAALLSASINLSLLLFLLTQG